MATPQTDESQMAQRPQLSAVLEQQAWEHFSAQYHGARRDELEYYPKLAAAWNEWQKAWALATGIEREACARVCADLAEEAAGKNTGNTNFDESLSDLLLRHHELSAQRCADAIRTRSNK